MPLTNGEWCPASPLTVRLAGYLFTYYPNNGGVIVSTPSRLTPIDVGVIGEPRVMSEDQLERWARGWIDRAGFPHVAYSAKRETGEVQTPRDTTEG